MMKIEFNTDNDAFKNNGTFTEIQNIFSEITVLLALGYDESDIKDSNGNKVGHWSLEEK